MCFMSINRLYNSSRRVKEVYFRAKQKQVMYGQETYSYEK